MKICVIYSIWGSIFAAVASTNLPQVRWYPQNGITEGATIQLDCQVSPMVSGPAIWLKLDPQDPNNHELLSHGEILIRQDERLSVTHDPPTNTYSLMIEGVSYEDEGGYQCQVPIEPDEEEVQAAPPVIINLVEEREESSSAEILKSNSIILILILSLSSSLLLLQLSILFHE
ncbi:UNVERIFIED_CONTAM: hypothetical protein RMT77_008009 [Armadillidium vulgare]